MIAPDRSRHLIVAGSILLAHAAVVCGLLSIGPRLTSNADTPVNVRFISEASTPEQWQPPQFKLLTPDIVAPMPDAPLLDSQVMPASAPAISIPVQAQVARQLDSADSHSPRLISTVEYVREPSPRYPAQSRKLREQGLVVLRVLIDERGAACSVEVETSSGHSRLDHAAREAVQRAAFRPYVEDGSPRRAFVLIPIEFSLSRTSV